MCIRDRHRLYLQLQDLFQVLQAEQADSQRAGEHVLDVYKRQGHHYIFDTMQMERHRKLSPTICTKRSMPTLQDFVVRQGQKVPFLYDYNWDRSVQVLMIQSSVAYPASSPLGGDRLCSDVAVAGGSLGAFYRYRV